MDTVNNHINKMLAKTGSAGLDVVLNGGLPYHHIYLLKGQSGTGKTTLAMGFLMAGVANKEQGLNRKGVITLLIIAQYGMLGHEIKTPIDLTSITDTVILLRYFEAFGQVRQCIAILKKRTGGHENTIREMRIESQGIRIGPPLKDFQGVLTGLPHYLGKTEPLLDNP